MDHISATRDGETRWYGGPGGALGEGVGQSGNGCSVAGGGERRWPSARAGQAQRLTWTQQGQKRAKGGRFVRSLLGSKAHRSRGPGRTILLDLCARAISRSSRDLPRATNIPPIASCSWLLDFRDAFRRDTFVARGPRLGCVRSAEVALV